MMREILFRGKRIDNGEWVCGSFCMDALEQFNGLCGVDGFIRLYNKAEGKMQTHEVDRETVGQFTGLTDKNGKKIFEGDVCRLSDGPFVVEWKYSRWFLKRTKGQSLSFPWFASVAEKSVIVGNIHDNPELLEGGGV